MRWRICAGKRYLLEGKIEMDFVIFEEGKPIVCKALENGEFDYIEAASEGFNNKNYYDRQTPCDQDYLRKMAKDTRADELVWS